MEAANGGCLKGCWREAVLAFRRLRRRGQDPDGSANEDDLGSPEPAFLKVARCSQYFTNERLDKISGAPQELLRHDGKVFKPVRGGDFLAERAFYEQLCSTACDGVRELCPTFYGIRTADTMGLGKVDQSQDYLVLEDMLHTMRKPVVADIKMGTRKNWFRKTDLSRVEQRSRLQQDLKRTSGSLGWVIVGINTGLSATHVTKDMGKSLSDEEAIQRLVHFMSLAGPQNMQAAALHFSQELDKLTKWFERPDRHLQFYNSSLLFALDADPRRNRLRDGSGVAVKMIDFGHTVPVGDPTEDGSGYSTGLLSLRAIFTRLAKPDVDLTRDLTLTFHEGRPRAGVVAYAERAETLCILVISDAAGKGWIFPKGKVEDGESLEECALREGAEEAGLSRMKVAKVLPPRLVVKTGPKGSGLRLVNMVLVEALEMLPSPQDLVTSRLPPPQAVEHSLWRDPDFDDESQPRVRAWIPLSCAFDVLKAQWALCALQSAWKDLERLARDRVDGV